MGVNQKPKRALLAYCALAQKLNTPGIGITDALVPFLAQACADLEGELFDADKFSNAVLTHFDIKIPRLAALGLTEVLYNNRLLESVSSTGSATVYRHRRQSKSDDHAVTALTEDQVESVLDSFFTFCRGDERLKDISRERSDAAFLDRLLNVDSLRILGRKEAGIGIKKNPGTIVLNQSKQNEAGNVQKEELHLDFRMSQFLLDLQQSNQASFDLVSDIAFANMAAEAIACFREPSDEKSSLEGLTVYLDSPLLLDILGVNTEYAEYGKELLETIVSSGASPAVLDHCVLEAEAAIAAQLSYLRSGVNANSTRWGTSTKPAVLTALAGNVGTRAYERLGIEVHADPDTSLLHRRSQNAVGSVETEIRSRMQHWRNSDAQDHDRKSIWSLIAIRDTSVPCPKICESKWIFVTRNTALVSIANSAWQLWLAETTKHSAVHMEKWAPVSMSDKQFAGYIWARDGGGKVSISKARLLANCSAAVRPRSDVKARAYNLALEMFGKPEADDLAALLEDREGARSLMRATSGDPEDVTSDRLPYILEQVKLAAGEFAAERARQEAALELHAREEQHRAEVERLRVESETALQERQKANLEVEARLLRERKEAEEKLLQQQYERESLKGQNQSLLSAIAEHERAEKMRIIGVLSDGFDFAQSFYHRVRWLIAILYASLVILAGSITLDHPVLAVFLTGILTLIGFWFVPSALDRPLKWLSNCQLRDFVHEKDRSIDLPKDDPDYPNRTWEALRPLHNYD